MCTTMQPAGPNNSPGRLGPRHTPIGGFTNSPPVLTAPGAWATCGTCNFITDWTGVPHRPPFTVLRSPGETLRGFTGRMGCMFAAGTLRYPPYRRPPDGPFSPRGILGDPIHRYPIVGRLRLWLTDGWMGMPLNGVATEADGTVCDCPKYRCGGTWA